MFWVIVQVKWKGYKIGVFSTNISLYFENNKRYAQTYNGRQTGTQKSELIYNLSSGTNLNDLEWPLT